MSLTTARIASAAAALLLATGLSACNDSDKPAMDRDMGTDTDTKMSGAMTSSQMPSSAMMSPEMMSPAMEPSESMDSMAPSN
ncbi:hypothetical protein [Corynebacterium mayonis]|uniref:hypothetical protein n=1 Tax=Corynebacterium mayonis TaxID=3062461 RepID=UPI0031404953